MSSSNPKFDTFIRRTLANSESKSPEIRKKIYDAAFKSLESQIAKRALPPTQAMALHNSLQNTIAEIEAEYAHKAESNPIDDTINLRTEHSDTMDASLDSLSKPESSELTQHIETENFFSRYSSAIALFSITALLLFFAGWYLISFSSSTPSNSSKSNTQQTSNDTSSNELLNLNFANDLDQFTVRLGKDNKKSPRKLSGNLVVEGHTTLIGKEFIPVDINNAYLMTVRMKVRKAAGSKRPGIFIGFATYDKDKKLEKSKPGTHRYFVIQNTPLENVQRDKDGWITLSGIITQAVAARDAFRPTSKFAKPILVLNNRLNDQVLELKEIVITELQ